MTDEIELTPEWSEDRSLKRLRREEHGIEPDLGGMDLSRAETSHYDQSVALAKEALLVGLDPSDLSGLLSDPSSPEYDEVVQKILSAPQVSKRFSGMLNTLDARIAELVAGDENDSDVEGDTEPAPVADASPDDEVEEDDIFDLLNKAESGVEQIELLEGITGDAESAGVLLDQLVAASAAQDTDAMEALVIQAMAVSKGADEGTANSEVEELRLKNQLLELQAQYPDGSKLIEQLMAGGDLEEQVAAAQAFAERRELAPVPDVDRNSPARPLKQGGMSALYAGEMTDEVAAALLADAGPGSLTSSRRGGWG